MTTPIIDTATMSWDGGSTSATATLNNNPWMGRIGQGMQVGGSLISGYSQIRQADEMSKNASKEMAFTVNQIFDTYSQLFEEMGERNRKLYAAQDVAVATSGLDPSSGSAMAVLDEAVATAKKSKTRLENRMQSELQAAAYRKRQIKKQAKRSKRYAGISTAINIGTMMFGGGA